MQELPAGPDTELGSGSQDISPAQAQQLALADPRTPVLDEATSLLAPRAAGYLERSTAHDADTVVVMEDGRTTEWSASPRCTT